MSSYICTICQEVFLFHIENKDEQPYALRCGHIFHNKCLSQWKANVNKCPQCRATAQHPVRLFFIADDSEENKEEIDAITLKIDYDRIKNDFNEIKKLNKELLCTLDEKKHAISNLKFQRDEYESLLPLVQQSVDNLRKETKKYLQTIANLEAELKTKKTQMDQYENIKTILDENVDTIEVEKYKNMKPDVMANIVNQWKRNANYYKQKETSDRSKMSTLLQENQKLKTLNKKANEENIKLKEERDTLKHVVETHEVLDVNIEIPQKSGLRECTHPNGSNHQKRDSDSFILDTSPLVKKMKITNVNPILNKKKGTSLSDVFQLSNFSSCTSSLDNVFSTESTSTISSNNQKKRNIDVSGNVPSSKNKFQIKTSNNSTKNSNLFKRAHSFKSSFDIMNHFNK